MRRTRVPERFPLPPIRPSRPNPYTGSPLDRAAERRDDDAFVATALAASTTLVVPIWRTQSVFRGNAARFFAPFEAARWGTEAHHWIFLGLWEARPVFALDLGFHDDGLTLLPEDEGVFADLRLLSGALPAEEAAILAHARGMVHWQSRTRFCGLCGSPCVPRSAGHVMRCTGCGTDHFPRSDPAVIMLVVQEDRVLLVRRRNPPDVGRWSLPGGRLDTVR